MNRLPLLLAVDGDALVIHAADGTQLESRCDGAGQGLAASELLAAALGSCIAASLRPLLLRHGVDETRLALEIAGHSTDLAAGFIVRVALPAVPVAVLERCRRAATRCSVVRALRLPVHIDWLET